MPSRATIKSLLVTPSSFARSMTFTRPATAPLPPPPVLRDLGDALARRAHCAFERMRQTSRHECLLEALRRRAHVGAAPRRAASPVHYHLPVASPHQSHQ